MATDKNDATADAADEKKDMTPEERVAWLRERVRQCGCHLPYTTMRFFRVSLFLLPFTNIHTYTCHQPTRVSWSKHQKSGNGSK